MKKSSKKFLFLSVFASLGTLAATACTDNDQTANSSLKTKDSSESKPTSENGKQEATNTSGSDTSSGKSNHQAGTTSTGNMDKNDVSKSSTSSPRTSHNNGQKSLAEGESKETGMDKAKETVSTSQDQNTSHPDQTENTQGSEPHKKVPEADAEGTNEKQNKADMGENGSLPSESTMTPAQGSGGGAEITPTAPAEPSGSQTQTHGTENEKMPAEQK